MKVILDASSAVSLTLDPMHPQSRSDNEIIQKSDNIICPDIFIPEIINTFWKYCQYEKMEFKKAEKYTEYILSLIDQFISSDTLWRQTLEMGINTSHSTYDCFYLVVAMNNNAILLTRDKKLQHLAKDINIKTQ